MSKSIESWKIELSFYRFFQVINRPSVAQRNSLSPYGGNDHPSTKITTLRLQYQFKNNEHSPGVVGEYKAQTITRKAVEYSQITGEKERAERYFHGVQ